MSLSDDIKIIAKTDLLESKIGRALGQAETDTSTSAILGETGASASTVPGKGSTSTITSSSQLTTISGAVQSITQSNFGGSVVGLAGTSTTTTTPTQLNFAIQQDYYNQVTGDAGGTSSLQLKTPLKSTTGNTNMQYNVQGSGGNFIPAQTGGSSGDSSSLYGGASGQSIGGSDIVDIATSATDATLTGIQASSTYTSADSTAQQDFNDNYFSQKYGEPGVFTAQQIADNHNITPGLQLSDDGSALVSGGEVAASALSAIIGFDPRGTTSAVTGTILATKIQLGRNSTSDNYPIPTATDLAGIYPPQDAWTDGSTPPNQHSYTAGSVWYLISGATKVFSQTFYGLLTQRAALDGTTCYSMNTPGALGVVSSLFPVPGDHLQFGAAGHTIGDSSGSIGGTAYDYQAGNTVGVGKYGQPACGSVVGDTTVCSLTAPKETAWPQTGSVIRNLYQGSFSYNPYDSEQPFYNKQASSVAIVNVGNGGSVIDPRSLTIQTAIQGGTLVSVYSGANGQGALQNANYYDSQGLLRAVTGDSIVASYYLPKAQ